MHVFLGSGAPILIESHAPLGMSGEAQVLGTSFLMPFKSCDIMTIQFLSQKVSLSHDLNASSKPGKGSYGETNNIVATEPRATQNDCKDHTTVSGTSNKAIQHVFEVTCCFNILTNK